MATAEYANPLAGAKVTAERIDQGVDYAGTGTLGAIARGVVTKVLPPGQSGWPGYFIEYKVTDPNSPLLGQPIAYAEGVKPSVHVGQTVNAGDPIGTLIPGWSTGIELLFSSGVGSSSYAASHGGYSEGRYTAAGAALSDLIGLLGGPQGKITGGAQPGSTAPAGASQLLTPSGRLQLSSGGGSPVGSLISGAAGAVGDAGTAIAGTASSVASTAADAATSTVNLAQDVGGFLAHPERVLLTIGLVAIGAVMIYGGAGRMLGFDAPVKTTVQRAAIAAAAKGA